jgi:hypothetical protein
MEVFTIRPNHHSLQKSSNSYKANLTRDFRLKELTGLTGLNGLTGYTGLTGLTGLTGYTGLTGLTGLTDYTWLTKKKRTKAHGINGPKLEDFLSDQEMKRWLEDLYSQYIDLQS